MWAQRFIRHPVSLEPTVLALHPLWASQKHLANACSPCMQQEKSHWIMWFLAFFPLLFISRSPCQGWPFIQVWSQTNLTRCFYHPHHIAHFQWAFLFFPSDVPALLSLILEVTGSMFSCEQSGKQRSGLIFSREPSSPHTSKLPLCLLADWGRVSLESVPATNYGVSLSVSRLHTSPVCFPTFTVTQAHEGGYRVLEARLSTTQVVFDGCRRCLWRNPPKNPIALDLVYSL